MKNVDSWWKKALKFFLPLPKEEVKTVIKEDVLEKAIKEAEVSLKKFDKVVAKEPKRARGTKGRYKADDKSTADINEAWVGGKAPKRKASKKPKAKKTKVTSIEKKK
tara:strand:+ start:50 stop:370 length:321 start_codon:yes stop_codon:yes gene_type:complete